MSLSVTEKEFLPSSEINPMEQVATDASSTTENMEKPEKDDDFRSHSQPYSSENFKICLHNLPRYVGVRELKKLLKRHGLDAKKAYIAGDHAYACFGDESTVVRAMDVFKNFTWKKKLLRVKRAQPAADPVEQSKAKKMRKESRDDGENSNNDLNAETVLLNEKSPTQQLLDAVTPLHSVPYADQLSEKQRDSEQLLKSISKKIRDVADEDADRHILPDIGYFGRLLPVLPSPAINGYRNKCEFSVGYDKENRAVVGFRLSRYKDGNTEIVAPTECPHVPEMMKRIVDAFQKFIVSQPDLPPYDVSKKGGFWSLLTVRQFLMDTLVIVTVYPRGVDAQRLQAVKSDLISLFLSTNDDFRATSLYFQCLENASDRPIYEYLGGATYVYENLLNLRFRVSPGAFFQVNTAACETLYSTVASACLLDEKTLVLDICCGTGTIGISLASKVGRVIGIELCAEAVEDARVNAQNNKMKNCTFVCGKAEDVFDEIRRDGDAGFERVVGILDPPRAGLPGKLLHSIRLFSALRTLVYVSCNPQAATDNFVNLTRRSSKRYGGEPFALKSVQPVDMFPHTKHCEWILLFER